MGMGNPLQSFKLAIMELQVKELQKADVKVCCLHEESKNEKQLMESKYSIVFGHLKLHKIENAKTTN